MKMNELLKSLDKEKVLSQIRRAGITEYGTLNEGLAEKLDRFFQSGREEGTPVLAAGGLNNNDFSHMLLDILKKEPEKVLTGLGVTAWLTDADRAVLYLPEEETELAGIVEKSAKEMEMDLLIVNEIADMRLLRNGIINHIQTLAAVADVLNDRYEAKTLVSVVKYTDSKTAVTVSEPRYVSFGTQM